MRDPTGNAVLPCEPPNRVAEEHSLDLTVDEDAPSDHVGLRCPNLRDQLLLVVAGILARGAEGLDRGGVGESPARVDPEVVADEARGIADAVESRRRELRVPAVRGQTDVVTDRPQPWTVELDRRVDAVVRAP